MTEIVPPDEIARWLRVTGPQLRKWLRVRAKAGHPLLASHQRYARWEFTPAEAHQLMDEYAASDRTSKPPRLTETVGKPQHAQVTGTRSVPARMQRLFSQGSGHRATEEWMGEKVVTLADLLRPGLQAVVVGINPSPVSVAAGHYYQGKSGQRFFEYLARAGLLRRGDGFEDDRAFAAGIGFTDVVKRPTANKKSVRQEELNHGRQLMEMKLAALAVPRIVFAFKCAATPLLGSFDGHGLRPGCPLVGAEVFVMPGPMEKGDRVERALCQLRGWWARHHPPDSTSS